MIKRFFLLFTVLYSYTIFSQTTQIDNFQLNYAFPSTTVPEKASLLKLDQFPNIGAIGGTNISIPIYTLKLDGMDIPLAMTYNTKGVKVADIASNVGLGWSLTGDGSIEYQINDLYDFLWQDWEVPGGFDSPGPVLEPFMIGYLWNGDALNMHHRDDASPDFFYVNAPGFKNTFYVHANINNINTNASTYSPIFFEKDDIKYLPLVAETNSTQTFHYFGNFTFTTRNGFTYKFSDPSFVLTRNYNYLPLNYFIFDGGSSNYTNYKLTELISPHSSNKINYTYEDYTNDYNHPQLIRNNDMYYGGGDLALGNVSPNSSITYFNTRSTTNYTKTKRLKYIESADTKILFNYDDTRLDYPGGRLQSIQITDKFNGKIIKTITLYHSYFIPNETACTNNYDCLRLRLDKVYDSTTGYYSFSYGENNSDYKFPRRSSSKIDYAGYYNGNNSDIRIYSDSEATTVSTNPNYYRQGQIFHYNNMTKDSYIPFELNNYTASSSYGTINLASNYLSLIGLLTKVKYPTGGEMDITYENDRFNYLGSDYPSGSARVSKLELKDEIGILKSIGYDYNLDNGFSSGQIAGFIPPSGNGSFALVMGLELNNNNTVVYSKVTEQIEGKGKTESYYSNYDKYPNRLGEVSAGCWNISTDVCNNWVAKIKELKYPYINIYKPDQRRGQLEKKIIFNNNGDILKEIETNYNYSENEGVLLQSPFVTSDGFKYGIIQNHLLQTYSNNLKKETTKDYLDGVEIKTEKEYTYDLNRNLLKTIDEISPTTITSKTVNYAEDKNDNVLINANMKSIPVEVEVSKKENNILKTISHSEVIYKNVNTDKVQQSQEIAYDLNNNTPEVEKSYDIYDSKGNLVQYTLKNGTPVTIIWGYYQTQPIAKIEGAFYNTIKNNAWIVSSINASDNDASNPGNEIVLVTALDNLRKDEAFKDYRITTYTYDLLIGMTSVTQTNGTKEYYKYDTANRLEKILDKDENVIKQFKYNYAAIKHYNVAKSQPFFRNNCPSGQLGASYTYTVPAGTYMSLDSQEAADQMAQTEINNNGQNAANTYGVCYYPSCNFNSSISSSYVLMQYAPFQKVNSVVNAELHFMVKSNSGANWSNGVLIGYIDSLCWPSTSVFKSIDSNWSISIYQGSGQVVLTWKGSGSPSTTAVYNLIFNYNIY